MLLGLPISFSPSPPPFPSPLLLFFFLINSLLALRNKELCRYNNGKLTWPCQNNRITTRVPSADSSTNKPSVTLAGKLWRRFAEDDHQGNASLSSLMYPFNPRGNPSSRRASYFSIKYVAFLAKRLARLNCISHNPFSRSSRSHAKCFVSTCYPLVARLSIQNAMDLS